MVLTHPIRRLLALILSCALVVGFLGHQPARAQTGELITNGSFASIAGTGLPTGWSAWNPTGDATTVLEPTAGPQGGPAVRISANPGTDTTDRSAIVQRIAVSDATPRTLTLSASMKAEGLSATNWTSLRLQARNAANATTVAVMYVGRDTGSYDWRKVSQTIELPLGTTTVMVEPMLDRSGGTVWFSNVSLKPSSAVGNVQASVTAAGVTELGWSFTGLDPHHYAIFRADGDADPTLDVDHLVGTAWAATWADTATRPGQDYTYVVRALDANGKTLADSDPVTVRTPASFTSPQANTVITAVQIGQDIRAGWTLGADVDPGTPLSVWVSHKPMDSPQPPAQRVAEVAPEQTSVTLIRPHHLNQQVYVHLVADGRILASSRVGNSTHPRTVLTTEVLRGIRQNLDQEPTITGAWQDVKKRLDTDTYGAGTANALYKAREAAFVFQVTGEQKYAEIAYEAALDGSAHVVAYEVNMGLELGRAMLLLGPIYDWAYPGWTDQQRATVRQLIMKGSDLLSTYHHDALDNVEKTSNWIAVARTTELAALMAIRGDGEAGLYEGRIAFLTDQVMQHLAQGYTANGYTQEGWDYLHYAGLYMLPSAYAAMDAGMIDLLPHLQRPQWWNVALHTLSARPTLNMAQWGVGTERNQTHGIMPLLMPLTPADAQPGLRWTYEVTRGAKAPTPLWDGTQSLLTVVYWQPGHSSPDKLKAPAAHTAILDDVPGSYWFRSGYTGADDVLATVNNRNTQHKGWSGSETFGLSLQGLDTTWAVMGAKSTNPLMFSKPLVDGKLETRGQYETVRGEGVTLASKAYAGQGGGYLHLDGSKNFEVATATREAVVDLGNPAAKAVLAFNDTFGDDSSHRWDWQLRPEAGVAITIAADGRTFTFRRSDQTMTGVILGSGYTVANLGGTLRISATGTSAQFRVLLAVGATDVVVQDDHTVRVGEVAYDLNRLGAFDGGPA
ncbi:hypothetical protein IPV09_11040 [Tessaracoccus sp. SD287]|uniref:hypothetical protein n=1 Tax=Tessaracoccus sp. SD287 TaxID=2782008 RepID=UPI001A95CC0B|nr:hypothetical protein [Tessaracoccus sp. SD287]MBO1031869.1 hypothetical protein [Tessaracoccus sp. SD287]